MHQISFKKIFKTDQKEVAWAFANATLHTYHHGLKILRADYPAPAPEHGKMIIVTPRACGKAHDRNKIRRRIKAIFYEEQLYKRPCFWIVLVRNKAMSYDFDIIKTYLTTRLVIQQKTV
jgi:ribonuclease P protein component